MDSAEEERLLSKKSRYLSTSIKASWLERSTVERRSVESLSCEEFVERYERPGVPVIITGCVTQWPAFTEWTAARLEERFGDVSFRVSATRDERLRDFLAYARSAVPASEERPAYLFDKAFAAKCPAMRDEFEIPKYFKEDLMGVLGGAEERPDYRWLIVGPRLSGSSFHVDPNANFAWNATIEGSKKWVLYPPDCPPPVASETDRQRCLPAWFHEHYEADDSKALREECVTSAGELLFVPPGWWHCVMNLELSVALTHNVVTTQNLLAAVDFLRQARQSCEPDEGCRGNEKFDFSGDVPTSVIFPDAETTPNDRAEQPASSTPAAAQDGGNAAAATATATTSESEPCACSRAHSSLLADFEAGLARRRPNLLEGLLKQRADRASPWAKLGLSKDNQPEAAPRAFSFAFGSAS